MLNALPHAPARERVTGLVNRTATQCLSFALPGQISTTPTCCVHRPCCTRLYRSKVNSSPFGQEGIRLQANSRRALRIGTSPLAIRIKRPQFFHRYRSPLVKNKLTLDHSNGVPSCSLLAKESSWLGYSGDCRSVQFWGRCNAARLIRTLQPVVEARRTCQRLAVTLFCGQLQHPFS